jgi:hypothetical protein
MRQRAVGHMLDLGFHAGIGGNGGNGYCVMPLLPEFLSKGLQCRCWCR